MTVRKDIRFRVYVAFTCICLFGIAIIVKAATLQIKDGEVLRAYAKSMHMRTTDLPAERGNIYTENGELLCSTIPQFDVHIDFSVIDSALFEDSVRYLAEGIANVLNDKSASSYERVLRKEYRDESRYWRLSRNLPYYEFQKLRKLPIFNRSKNRGGFIADTKIKRINPYGKLAYRTIGLYRENAKTVGLEATLDSILKGYNGSRVEKKATGGLWMPVEGSEVEPRNGRDIVTTIDINIQDVAENALESILKKYECLYGTCVVMEVPTGKVRALVNLGRQQNGEYWEDFNYAMMRTEPGSTFKLMTLFSLLRDKYLTIEDKVDAEGGRIKFGSLTMYDSHFGLHSMTIKDAFAHSSNVAMAKLADKYYINKPDQFLSNLKRLHIHERTGIDILGERKPLLKNPESKTWTRTTLPWMATGYEVMITPLHTAMVYNAIANGGKLMRPYLVSEVREYGKTIQRFNPVAIEDQLADSQTINQLRACVEEVALTGTAKSIRSPYYSIAGKTGTAQVADKGIRYSDRVYQGSFVGYFPAEHPRYTIAVVVRTKPHSSAYYGGTVAAPVFRMIADKIFASGKGWDSPLDSIAKGNEAAMVAQATTESNYYALFKGLGQQPLTDRSAFVKQLASDTARNTVVKSRSVYKGIVPNVEGMSLRDAVYLLEREGLTVHIEGSGRVKAQSIVPGTPAEKGKTIRIELS